MIVRRDREDVYESLRRSFSAHSGIVVLLDRRLRDRRHESTGAAEERRRSDRRAASHVDEELGLFGHAVAYQAEESGRHAEPGDDLSAR